MSQSVHIRFRDLVRRDEEARRSLADAKRTLAERKHPTAEEQDELRRIEEVLGRLHKAPKLEVADPLFVAARDCLNDKRNAGLIGKKILNFSDTGEMRAKGATDQDGIEFGDVVRVALILGLLAIDEAHPPRLKFQKTDEKHDPELVADPKDPANLLFGRAFFAAYGEAQSSERLAMLVLSILDEEGDPNGSDHAGTVDTAEFARVIRSLREKGVSDGEPQLRRRVNECLDRIQSVGVEKPYAEIGIELPNLNDVADYQIQTDNVRLMGAVICSAMFEELKVYQVLDKLVELAQNGMLPIGRGKAGEALYRYWKETPNRLSEAERRNLYARTIGIPGGDANGMVNREFNDLWLRFVSSVSSLVRQQYADNLLRSNLPAGISQQHVRKAARDLALNLSLHGYGMVVFHAIELQTQIKMMIDLLCDREIMSAYGARDMWQVVDQVATLELGGARNSARYRTLATCGAIISSWLANNVRRYNESTSPKVINMQEVASLEPPTSGAKATTTPTDYDLVNACELWLADTATSEDRIEEFSQPREAPMSTSRPVQIPSVVRDMLDQAGVTGFGLGMGAVRQ